ncbi:ankyrin repeat-containing domain protein [Russula emetica]|nr:ankyrin repeat-containing domain protein [Russula emetica]
MRASTSPAHPFTLTGLDRAAQQTFLDIACFLIERGAAVLARDNNGWTGIPHGIGLWASPHCKVPAGLSWSVESMSIFGAEMEIGETSLYLASVGGRLDVVRFLIEQGTDSNGWTLLHAASHSGHLGVVKLLLRRGVDVLVRPLQDSEQQEVKTTRPGDEAAPEQDGDGADVRLHTHEREEEEAGDNGDDIPGTRQGT